MSLDDIWISEDEEKFLDVGYVIGFFNSDGYFSINNSGDFQLAFVQRTNEPLQKIQKTLDTIGIKSRLKPRKDRKNGWKLHIAYDSALELVRLLEGRIKGQKAKELPIIKKLILLRENYEGKNWKAENQEELRDIIEDWQELREKYESDGVEIKRRLSGEE